MIDFVLNKDTWMKGRSLHFCPTHFIMANTPMTTASKVWILEHLHGRFYMQGDPELIWAVPDPTKINVFFEDPQELILYELTWS